jgi:hypothetical protein
MNGVVIGIIFCVVFCVKEMSADYPPLKPVDNSNFGRNISRTMHLLATSTPQQRNTVKILVYGQSITRGDYWLTLKSYLQQKFPNANLIMENLAIGGFSVPKLSQPAEQDVFPFYPDMILFHVYGPEPDYENLIREFRLRTSAEIAIQTDHVTPTDDPNWEQHHSFEWLPALCATYGLQCLDIRHPWQGYLEQYKINASELLKDGVHPNDWGNWLMASIIEWYLRYDSSFPVDPFGLATTYVIGKDIHWQNGTIQFQINGNRVDLIAANPTRPGTKTAKIFIDGKAPSTYPNCYTFTRPNFQTADTTSDWPWDIGSVVRVDKYVPLVEEDWTLTFTSINNASADYFTFSLEGSVTGPDGTGNSNEYFVSKSGRDFKSNGNQNSWEQTSTLFLR